MSGRRTADLSEISIRQLAITIRKNEDVVVRIVAEQAGHATIRFLTEETTDGEAVEKLPASATGMAIRTRTVAGDFPIRNERRFISIGCDGNQSSVMNCRDAMKITLAGGTFRVSHATWVGVWKRASLLRGGARNKRVRIANLDGNHVGRVSKVEIYPEQTDMATSRAL